LYESFYSKEELSAECMQLGQSDGWISLTSSTQSPPLPIISFFTLEIASHVGGLPPNVDNAELKTIFEAFGTVADAIVMVDQVTQRSRCFGVVTFGGEDGPAAAQDPLLHSLWPYTVDTSKSNSPLLERNKPETQTSNADLRLDPNP
jgi:hypothetical protein